MNTDQHLNEVALKQLTWKPSPMRAIAVRIVETFKASPDGDTIYGDEVALAFVAPGDVNCIGSAWRLLTSAGIIAPTGTFRRSEKETSRGRKVFGYKLISRHLAQVFWDRNHVPELVKTNLL